MLDDAYNQILSFIKSIPLFASSLAALLAIIDRILHRIENITKNIATVFAKRVEYVEKEITYLEKKNEHIEKKSAFLDKVIKVAFAISVLIIVAVFGYYLIVSSNNPQEVPEIKNEENPKLNQ